MADHFISLNRGKNGFRSDDFRTGTTSSDVRATGTLTFAGNPANLDTVTIDAKVYTFQTVLTNVDGNILIGAAATDSRDNLMDAINLGGGSGTRYAAATTLHPTVSASKTAGNMLATAKVIGAAGNSIATTKSAANLSWGGATLSGGSVDDVELRVSDGASLTKKDMLIVNEAFERFFENSQQIVAAGFVISG
jgi:hypothetical protein